jgi:hypothetical protein
MKRWQRAQSLLPRRQGRTRLSRFDDHLLLQCHQRPRGKNCNGHHQTPAHDSRALSLSGLHCAMWALHAINQGDHGRTAASANGRRSCSYLRGDWPLSRAATDHVAESPEGVGIRVEGGEGQTVLPGALSSSHRLRNAALPAWHRSTVWSHSGAFDLRDGIASAIPNARPERNRASQFTVWPGSVFNFANGSTTVAPAHPSPISAPAPGKRTLRWP